MDHEDNIGPNAGKVFYVHFDQNDNWKPDPETLAWLEAFVRTMGDDSIYFGDPTEMQELEYMDSTVIGDHHPEAFNMIMDAFYKHEGRQP
jgi:hypothetical protein